MFACISNARSYTRKQKRTEKYKNIRVSKTIPQRNIFHSFGMIIKSFTAKDIPRFNNLFLDQPTLDPLLRIITFLAIRNEIMS